MRVGIANPFAYRPHVAQMVFLTRQLQRLGHQTYFLGCGGGLRNCNSQVNKTGIVRNLECFKCRAGGLRSYLKVDLARLDLPVQTTHADLELGGECAFSTAATALQVEQTSEASAPDFQALQASLRDSAATAYANTRRWLSENQLDCLFVFNGRFDLTRAVIEACSAESVRFVSVERSWFGDGLQLLPGENCLGLRNIRSMCERWASKPLTYDQAARASQLIAKRVMRASLAEWRQYNLVNTARYGDDSIRYLFLPSSQHEWLGHPDRTCEWQHPVEGIEYLFGRLELPLKALVVRGHPGWAMKIKNYGRNRANEFYRDWTQRVGAEYIEPSSGVDTHQLMKISRLVFLNGSSASMEAAWLGKPIVSFVPAAFTSSGISLNLFSRKDIDHLDGSVVKMFTNPTLDAEDPETQCRLVLRYIYCINFRLMQFVDSVKGVSPYSFRVNDPSDLSGLQSLVSEGLLVEHDANFDTDATAETQIVHAILSGNWESAHADVRAAGQGHPLRRRLGYRFIDLLTP